MPLAAPEMLRARRQPVPPPQIVNSPRLRGSASLAPSAYHRTCSTSAKVGRAEAASQLAESTEAGTPPSLSHFVTGGRLGSIGSSRTLLPPSQLPLPGDKQIVLVRHGMSTWNLEGRIQGSSDEPELTDFGKEQARLTRDALANFPFKACFTSTIRRAAECADILWEERDGPLVRMDDLREADLGYLQGMTNSHAEREHPEVYGTWRSRPEDFIIDGKRPVHEVFGRARKAWQEILEHPSDVTLVVSHKSVLRAMFSVAMGLGPDGFRALDVHNAGVSIFWVNKNAEAMLQNMNLTTHLALPLKY